MLGPASSESEGAGSGTGRVRAFSLVTRAFWCWCGAVVSAVRARGLPGGWPYLLQDVRVCQLPHSAPSSELAVRTEGAGRWRPGRGVSCLDVGRPGSGALPRPTARPSGVRPGPVTHWLWVRGCRRGDPSPTPQRALLPAGCARCEAGSRAPGGGGFFSLGVGRLELGALPRPTARLSGVRPGPVTLWLWVRGMWAREPVTYPTARPYELAVRAVGAARGRPRGGGGAFLAWVWDVLAWALSHVRHRPWGVRPGPATHWLWVQGPWASGPVTYPKARSCKLVVRAVGAVRGGPGGRASVAWVWGVWGWALSHARPPVL